MRRSAKLLLLAAVALALSDVEAVAQARGVVIQIPDDVGPGSARPAPAPPPAAPPAASPVAPSTGAAPTPPTGGVTTACQGAACAPASNAWHVLNTSNKTCLVLSKNDLRGGKDVRRLSTLLPAPLFVVASGACP